VALIGFWLTVFAGSAAWYMFSDRAFWLLTGSLACLIVSVPLVAGQAYEAISPWSLLLAGGYLGFGIRGAFMSFGIQGNRSLDSLYFLGRNPDEFVRPASIFLIGLALLTLGYTLAGRLNAGDRAARDGGHLPAGQTTLVVTIAAAVGFLAFLWYARATGGLSLSHFSAKRTTISGLDLGAGYQSHGGLRVLATYSTLAFWLQVAVYARRNVRLRIVSVQALWLAALFLNAALLPFYASTRSDVLYTIIGALTIQFCLRRDAHRFRTLVIATALVLAIGGVMTSLREARTNDDGVATSLSAQSVVSGFVLSRTVADVATSSNIIRAVPSDLPYATGTTITTWAAAPIPRSVWPDKPIISVGPILGSVIYGNQRAGVPPGVVAESYWNFGFGGVMVLPILVGAALRWLNDRWAPNAMTSPTAAVTLAAVAVRPGLSVISGSIGYVAFQVVQMLILLLPLLLLTNSPTRETGVTTARGSGGGRLGRRLPQPR
jgi:hypothetical protein